MVWSTGTTDANNGSTFAQRLNSSAVAQDSPFVVAPATDNDNATAVMDGNGDVMAVWGNTSGVVEQHFNAQDQMVGAAAFPLVEPATSGPVTVAASETGDFTVSWEPPRNVPGSDTQWSDIYAQNFVASATNQPVQLVSTIPNQTVAAQTHLVVQASQFIKDPDGDLVSYSSTVVGSGALGCRQPRPG